MTQLSWFVYVLKSSFRDWFYVGFTQDLARRMREHDAGRVHSTKAYRPLILVAYIALPTERKARELEKYFKTGSGKAILKKRILTDEAP
jgi:predicted GIY-YIG superfamily endonuclease